MSESPKDSSDDSVARPYIDRSIKIYPTQKALRVKRKVIKYWPFIQWALLSGQHTSTTHFHSNSPIWFIYKCFFDQTGSEAEVKLVFRMWILNRSFWHTHCQNNSWGRLNAVDTIFKWSKATIEWYCIYFFHVFEVIFYVQTILFVILRGDTDSLGFAPHKIDFFSPWNYI